MINFFIGVIFGICATTIGFQGIAKYADKGVEKTQEIVKSVTK